MPLHRDPGSADAYEIALASLADHIVAHKMEEMLARNKIITLL